MRIVAESSLNFAFHQLTAVQVWVTSQDVVGIRPRCEMDASIIDQVRNQQPSISPCLC